MSRCSVNTDRELDGDPRRVSGRRWTSPGVRGTLPNVWMCERDPRTSFQGKLCVAPRAWLVGRSLASLSGRPVARYCCGHRYGLYRREPLRLFRDIVEQPRRFDPTVPVKRGFCFHSAMMSTQCLHTVDTGPFTAMRILPRCNAANSITSDMTR